MAAKQKIKVKAKVKSEKNIETQIIKPTEDELILGAKEEIKKIEVVDYTSKQAKYNVYVYANGRTVKVNGAEIGTFLGMDYVARNLLKTGEKEVLIKDDKKNELYRIEVIE